LFNGCRSYSYEYINQEVKDYFTFKERSYWIYQDSVTNNIDSVVLIQSLFKFIEDDGEWGHIFMVETYESKYCHYLSDTSIFLSYLLNFWDYRFPTISFNSGIQDVEKNRILWFSYYNSTDYLHSYNIGENIFDNVKIQKNTPIRDYSTKSYWVKNIGLIRYEIYNSNDEIINTYNLIKYNVKPYNK
jgi:hypothetical protein